MVGKPKKVVYLARNGILRLNNKKGKWENQNESFGTFKILPNTLKSKGGIPHFFSRSQHTKENAFRDVPTSLS
jgi:hypothetical protein